jgi:hypothetical protein
MKPNKGLYIDNRPTEQPDATYPYGKNGVQHDMLGTMFNEPGFKRLALKAPYKINGCIESPTYPIVFSTDNTNSAVGLLDFDNDQYIPIIDDATWDVWDDAAKTVRSKIGFKLENYIKGQAQKNYKDELVCVFSDKVLFPMHLNCTNPSIKAVSDLRLFAFFTTPNISVVMESGGSLQAGAYYVALGYEKNDGTSTPYTDASNVTIVTSGTIQGTNDKILRVSVSNVDTNYQYVRVAIISKIGGVTKVVELVDYVPVVGNTLEFTYTGTELTTDIDIAAVLTPPALYNRVMTIGQLNDYLYIGGCYEEHDFDDMQNYANLVQMEWVSELVDALNPPVEHVSGKKKTLRHNEVYAFYIRYGKTRGGKTKWFTLAGPDVTAGSPETIGSPEAQAGGGISTRFKVEDTIPYYNFSDKSGGFGIWLNSTEKYPDTPEFDSSALGGPNLRGKAVRHHKTPSHRWLSNKYYPQETTYGQSKLDLLGFRALNVRIPDQYKDLINGYEIGYAIRTTGNMTNYGQGMLMHGCTDHHADGKPTNQVPIYSSGGNYTTGIWHNADGNYDNANELGTLRMDTFRIHPFDILFNRPSIQPNYVSAQFKLRRNQLNTSDTWTLHGQLTGQGKNTGPEVYIIDYTTNSEVPKRVLTAGNSLRAITQSFYTLGIDVNQMIGYRHENAFCGYLSGTAGSFWQLNNTHAGHEPYQNGTGGGKALSFEEGIIVDLIVDKTDIYQNFYSQTLTSGGNVLPIGDTTILWGGDCFVSQYTFNTYGRYNSIDQDGSGIRGFKVARRIVCESVSNINLRYQIPGNIYSDYWPVSPVLYGDITNYLVNVDRSIDPNQFGYTKDFNQLNDLTSSVIWSPFQEYIYDHPYRIHRGGRASRTGRPRSWRTFLPLDYYEMQKNMGHLINLEGMDDRLIIHCENAMFLTQDKSKLEQGLISITLGAGDIFQFEPQEAISSKLGYGGTQHDISCIRNPFGYMFVNAKMGEIYLYKGKLSLINEGINTFLREFLAIPDVNTFSGNGITLGWDNKYKRIIATVKNKQLPDGTIIIPFQDSPNFWDNLTPGQIVYYNGRYIQYVGVNNTQYDCPPDPVNNIITWQPVDQYCLVDDQNRLTGIMGYKNRIRLVNGVADGYKEPNTQQGLGQYFPPIPNSMVCQPAGPTITWKGSNGVCLKNDVQTCPDDYTLEAAGCTQILTQPATPPTGGTGTQGIAAKANSEQWNNGGAKVYSPGYDATGNGTNTILATPHFWVNGNAQWDPGSRNLTDSRMNAAGIWVQGGMSGGVWTPTNEYIGFSRKLTVATARTVYIMMCADNDFKFSLNGTVLVDTHPNVGNIAGGPNFNFANIYPVALRAGDNYVEMYAQNLGSVAGFAAEIYDVTLSQLLSATNESQLNIIFSTKDIVGEPFDLGITVGYSCPDGWSLDTTGGVYTCVHIDVIPPNTEAGSVNNGIIHYNTRCRYEDNVADGYCEDNTNDGTGQGTYVADEPNAACNPVTPPSPGTVTITGTVDLVCADSQCNSVGGMQLNFHFSAPTPLRFKLLIAKISLYTNGIQGAVGTNVIGALPVDVEADTNYNVAEGGAALPFTVDIPAGATEFIATAYIYQDGYFEDGTNWKCNNCLYPVTDIYFKYDDAEQPASDTNTYVTAITATNANVTSHNP